MAIETVEVSPSISKDHYDNLRIIRKIEKLLLKETSLDNETYKIIRVILLVLSILTLCYYSLQYSTEFNILNNGQILPGFIISRRAVIAFSLGYSVWHSVVFAIAATMLVYSILSKRPQFSLPLMGLFLTEVIHDSCNASVTIWHFFRHFEPQIALSYTFGLLLLILTEIWAWLDVLWLYEFRSFETR